MNDLIILDNNIGYLSLRIINEERVYISNGPRNINIDSPFVIVCRGRKYDCYVSMYLEKVKEGWTVKDNYNCLRTNNIKDTLPRTVADILTHTVLDIFAEYFGKNKEVLHKFMKGTKIQSLEILVSSLRDNILELNTKLDEKWKEYNKLVKELEEVKK